MQLALFWKRLAAAVSLLIMGSQLAVAQDHRRAQDIVQQRCAVCHGAEGESSSPVFPRLAGQHAGYIARQLADYQSGKRVSATMQPMVQGLGSEDMAALGRWFESRPTRAHPVADAELAQVGRFIYQRGNSFSGLPACADCHGDNGHGNQRLPRLAGQHEQYTLNQLRAFLERKRTNDRSVMQAITPLLTELEKAAVAAYISGMP